MSSTEEIKESLEHAIHILKGILDDVNTGDYTPEKAALDAENLMMTDGLDYISVLLDYADESLSEHTYRFVEEFTKTEGREPTEDEIAKFRENASK
ncbi:MAG: hypothetical protein ACO3CH_00095 [Ilumatobacteraceae bacterium]